MEKTNFQPSPKKSEIDVNKPPEKSFWLKQGPFSIWYFIIMMILFYLFQSATQAKKEEIPYSEFQQYLAEGQVAECVIREKLITGTLRLTDEKSGKPRRSITLIWLKIWKNMVSNIAWRLKATFCATYSSTG